MIFLSHSWQNKPAAHKVVEALATERLPCWLDEQQLDYGVELRTSLRSAIAQSDIYLYLVSDAANNSEWVRDELQYALGLEFDKKLKIIPVRLADNDDELPALLSGRLYASLDSTIGGAARLAHNLTKISGCDRLPGNCRLSATVRLDKYRLVHTLAQARDFSVDCEISVLFLNDQYEALDALYWNVADVEFPIIQGQTAELAVATTKFVAEIHSRSRRVIEEVQSVCRRFLATDGTNRNKHYFEAGYERALRVMLHCLQWDTTYLRAIYDGQGLGDNFAKAMHLPEPFDGHRCDFVSENQKLGSVKVPQHAYPFHPHVKELVPWGLTDPFADMVQSEVGTAVGEILALRCMNQSLPSTEMPSPASLKYGLS